jgi:exonuclease SbcD
MGDLMKFIHTADWHIGKSLNQESLLDQQRYVLDQLVEAVRLDKPAALIIAGDLFDHPRPSAEAIELLDAYFNVIIHEAGVPILAISGNHDGAEFLNFGSAFMRRSGLFMMTQVEQMFQPIEIQDEFGTVQFFMLPFMTPVAIRSYFTQTDPAFDPESIKDYNQAMAAVTAKINIIKNPQARHVIVAHGFIMKTSHNLAHTPHVQQRYAQAREGERLITVGGTEYIYAHHFLPFHYVALGHLHGAHSVQAEHIRYAGSIYKYSRSEATQAKSYTVVNLDDQGQVTVDKKPLMLKNDVREVKLKPEDVHHELYSQDYVFVRVDTDVITPHLYQRVKTVFPNALEIGRYFDATETMDLIDILDWHAEKSEIDHLKDFFQHHTAKEISLEQLHLFEQSWQKVTKQGGNLV